MKGRKATSLLLSLAMALSLLPTGARAADGYTYENGVLTITADCQYSTLADLAQAGEVTTVVIGSDVTSLGAVNSFAGYSALKAITVDPSNTTYSAEDGVLFDQAGTRLVCCPAAKQDEYYILPHVVTKLAFNAFNGVAAKVYIRSEQESSLSTAYMNMLSGELPANRATYIDADSVALNETALELNKSATATLTAAVSPANATFTTVTWRSSDESVATVDAGGRVTAVANGEAVITAVAVGVDGRDEHQTASCDVTVITPAVSIAVPEDEPGADEEPVEIDTNATDAAKQTTLTVQIAAAAGGATEDVDVVWTVSDADIATLEAASSTGTTAALSARNIVTAKLVLAGSADSITVPAGTDGRSAVRVVPKKTGEVTVTATVATAEGTASKSFALHLTAWVSGVTLDREELKLDLDETATLTPTIAPEGAEYSAVEWTSDHPEFVSVVKNADNTATVTAVRNGDATVTVTVTDDAGKAHQASCSVQAWRPVASVSLNKSGVEVEVGTTAALTATVLPADARKKDVTWKSGDESIAAVDANGVVTGVALGTTFVTVTTVDEGKTATCAVTVKKTGAASIELDATALTLVLDDERTLTATIEPAETTDLGVIWRSSAPDVVEIVESQSTATVGEDESGSKKATATARIKVRKAGTATITATAADNGTLSASCVVTIDRIPVESVTVKDTAGDAVSELTLTIGNTVNLTAFVAPDDPTDGAVTWNIPETDVARFAEFTDSNERSGLTVTAAKAGTVTFTATADNQTATVTLTVYDAVTAIRYNDFEGLAPALTLAAGGKRTLGVTVSPATADQRVQWTSSAPAVASVNESTGEVEALAPGTAVITAASVASPAVKTALTLTVTQATGSIELDKTALTLSMTDGTKKTGTLTATITPANSTDAVTWESSDEDVVSVGEAESGTTRDGTGKTSTVTLTAQNGGTATITVRSGGKSAACAVTVPVPVESVAINESGVTVDFDKTTALTVTVLPATAANKTVRWSSDSPGVATVDENTGVVTGVAEGEAVITATAADGSGKTDSVTVKVWQMVTGVTLDKTTLSLDAGAVSAALVATVAPAEAKTKTVKWSSSDTNVATVANGVVTAVAPGAATITVTTDDQGKTATCTVTVSAVPVSGLTIKDAGGNAVSDVVLGTTSDTEKTLTVAIAPPNATYQTVNWQSSDTGVVTVAKINDVTAVLTAKSAGTADVTVSSAYGENGTTVTKICRVTVYAPVTAFALNKTATTLTLGTNTTETLSVTMSADADPGMTWESSKPGVATVDANGVVTAVAPGTAVITATSTANATATDSCTVTVLQPTTGLGLSDNTIALSLTETGKGSAVLTATITPSDTTDEVEWNVSGDAVQLGTIETSVTDGVKTSRATVVAHAGGTAVVTVRSGGKTASRELSVPTPTNYIQLSSNALSIIRNNTATLTAAVLPADATDKTVEWTFKAGAATDVASFTVGEDGTVTVTANKVGTTTIVATTADTDLSAECEIAVTPILATGVTLASTALTDGVITLKPTSAAVSLTATVAPNTADNTAVEWTLSKTGVVTIEEDEEDGNTLAIRPLALGTTVLTATAADDSGKYASCTITVEATAVESVAITAIGLDEGNKLPLDSEATLTAAITPEDATNRAVTWNSNDSSVVMLSVDEGTGVVTATAKKAGSATVTVTTADGGKTDRITITVPATPVASLTLTPKALTLTITDPRDGAAEGQLSVLAAGAGGRTPTDSTVRWASSDTSVATVDEAGKVSAVAPGTATVTVTPADGSDVSDACVVTVRQAVTAVTLGKTEVTLAKGDSEQMAVTFTPSAVNQSVTWSSDKPGIATVDETGKITAVSVGTATITVTSVTTPAAKATCTVTVTQATTSVTLDKGTLTLSMTDNTKKTGALTATILPADTTDTAAWSSSNESVATVRFDEETGKAIVTAVAKGTATIAVTSGSESAVCAVTVEDFSVTGVSLDQTSFTMKITDDPVTLTATIAPSDAANKTVTWSSSDESVAKVEDGTVTAAGVGSAIITVTTADGGKTASCYVTVTAIAVESVAITATGLDEGNQLALDGAATLTAAITPATATNKNVTWSSTDSSVVALSVNGETGVVTATAKKAGSATVMVTTADGGKVDRLTITVPATPVASLTLDRTELALEYRTPLTAAGRDTLTVTAAGAGGKAPTNAAVNWESSNESVATVDETGRVTATGAGEATIRVTPKDGSNVSATCTVRVTVPTTGIELDQSAVTLIIGRTGAYRLTAAVTPAGAAQNVTWTSGNESVATVVNGLVTAVGPGETKITAAATGTGYSAECVVTVELPTDSVTVTPASYTLILNGTEAQKTVTLRAALDPSNASDPVVWSSNNERVATVDQTGKVTAVGGGSAAITAASGGKSAACTVTVRVEVKDIALNETALTLEEGKTATLRATVEPTDATDKSLTWTSSNEDAATVENGVVTAIAEGETEITAAGGGKSAACAVTVTPILVRSVSLSTHQVSLKVGNAYDHLTAVVTPNNAKNKTVTWSSSNEDVATVDENGRITAVGVGAAAITASAGAAASGDVHTDTCYVNVETTAVTGISLDKASVTFTGYKGGSSSETLTATITPDSATEQGVVWTSSNPDVITVENAEKKAATITTTGQPGTAIITATAKGNAAQSAACDVTVPVWVTGVALDKAAVTLELNETFRLTAAVEGAAGRTPASDKRGVSWTSGNSSVATVDSDGTVTPVAAGTATITVTTSETGADGNPFTAACAVTVLPAPTGVTLSSGTLKLKVGDSDSLTATVAPSGATQTIRWSSSDGTVASVDQSGNVSALKNGTATITATSVRDNGKAASCTVTVWTPVTGVRITEGSAVSMKVGETLTLHGAAVPDDATPSTVDWSHTLSEAGVATAAENGANQLVITAAKAGTVTVTATTKGTVADGTTQMSTVCIVTVEQPVQGVTIVGGNTELVLAKNATAQQAALITPADADDQSVTWTTGDAGVATVSSDGLVTAAGEGTTTVTVTTADGAYTASRSIRVYIPVSGLTLSTASLALDMVESTAATLTAAVSPAGATARTVTWTSGNESVAAVSDASTTLSGGGTASVTVSAAGAGTATITATITDEAGTYTETCAVTVSKATLSLNKASLVLTPASTSDARKVRLTPYDGTTALTESYTGSATEWTTTSGSGYREYAFAPTGNSVQALTVSVGDGDPKYNAFDGSVSVIALMKPIVSASLDSGTLPQHSSLSVAVDQDSRTISVSGYVADPSILTDALLLEAITPALTNVVASGLTAESYTNGEGDSGYRVKYNGDTVCSYTLSKSAVVALAANIEVSSMVLVAGDDVKSPAAALTTETKTSLTNAAVGVIQQQNSGYDLENAEVQVDLRITQKSQSTNGVNSVSLNVDPSYTVTTRDEGGNSVELIGSADLHELAALIEISVRTKFVPAYVIHHPDANTLEFLNFTYTGPDADGYYTVIWQQQSFSQVDLLDAAEVQQGIIRFALYAGGDTTAVYDTGSLGAMLPTDSRVGSTFDGWRIGAITTKTLTAALLGAIDGTTLTAVPVFTAVETPEDPKDDPPQNGGSPNGGNPGEGSPAAAMKPDEEEQNEEETPEITTTVTFVDVSEDHWASAAINFVAERGIFKGIGGDRFAPELSMSRAMIAQMLFNFDEDAAAVVAGEAFSDTAGKWYERAAAWAAGVNVAGGENGVFHGDAAVTREQLAAMLYRYARYKGYDLAADGDLSGFSDAAAVSGWAETAMRWAVGHGVIGGTDRGLEPQSSATRAQVAAIMMRFCGRIAP